MTFSEAHNYQRQPIGNGRCSPNLRVIEAHVLDRFGGQPLGCYAPRAIRGGSSMSTHWSGAAVDLRYANVGAGYRNVVDVDALIAFVIDNHQALGVQQVHDYLRARIWKVGRGWKQQAPSSTGMGQPWAQWLHLEVHPSAFAWSTPIDARLDTPTPPAPPAPTQPEITMPTTQLTVTLDVLRPGAEGRDVKRLQAMLGAVWFGVAVDGIYGPQTEAVVRQFQQFCKLTVDGWVGPQTWRALLES